MSNSTSQLQGIDRTALERVVELAARAHGAEVVDMELRAEREGWVLRVYVEKAGAAAQGLSTRDAAVDLELCANVSRELSPALDVADLIQHAYHLEVSSPGVERPLRGERDFARFAGQKAKLKLREALDGQRVLVGTLGAVANGNVCVTSGARTYEVPLSSIDRARLVFEFGPQRPSAAKGAGAMRQSPARNTIKRHD
jgi:ribosome maturation factor RimP